MTDKILILDFGSQYTQLIARRIREQNVYCEICAYNNYENKIDNSIRGIVLSGSPFSVNDKNAPQISLKKIRKKIPILAICYGAQYLAKMGGGLIKKSKIREYGKANLIFVENNNFLMKNISKNSCVWMSHADTILTTGNNFETICSTENIKNAGYKIKEEQTYGLQFHPEVYHSEEGKSIIKNFIFNICDIKSLWTPECFINETVKKIKSIVKNDQVVLGLSGGVDSSVAGLLLHKAIGKQLHCVFIDNGLLRKNEFEMVLHQYKDIGLNMKGINAKELFYKRLKNITNPEEKRKIIGRVFIEVFDKEAKKIKNVKWLGQGTIYPDVIESISVNGPSSVIKSHHNVGGLPKTMSLKLVEPLRKLFKDEVRIIGNKLGLANTLIKRHPFPGPGLAVRILGEVTKKKIDILQQADFIFIEKLKETKLYDKIWQAGVVFLSINSVGVMGDERTYENVVALRAVTSTDGMTADWFHIPHKILGEISNSIINKVKGINRVVYDISSKPPSTIEWE